MIVLADRGNEQNLIEEERQEWINKVLSALGVPDDFFKLELEHMKEYLSNLEIEVWNFEGNIDIYMSGEIVAQWKEPKLILIKDHPKWYYEIHLNEWARPLQEL